MSWSSSGNRLAKLATGLAGVGLATGSVIYFGSRRRTQLDGVSPAGASPRSEKQSNRPFHLPLGKVLASWTTNFEPTTKWDDNWDRRDPSSIVKPSKDPNSEAEKENYKNKVKEATPKSSRHLILIRHGQYNTDGTKDVERMLTNLGREQAQLTGLRLKELAHPYTLLVHSNMTRARESCEIIHKHLPDLPLRVDELLQEGAPIPPEPPVGHWRPEADKFFKEGARIEAAFRKYFHRADAKQTEDTYEVVVCHANVIRYFVCRALQLPPEAWLRMSMYNGSVTWLSVRPSGRVSLRYHGDAGHMPPKMLTTN